MRRRGRVLLGLLMLMTGPVAIAVTATPAAAGSRPLTVTKVVDGTAPPGAQYVVDIDCEGTNVEPSQMTFTGPGSQTAQSFSPNVTCTVVESVTSGANVTYACEVTNQDDPDTACASDNAVFFGSGVDAATITITNTFAPAPAPSPSPPPEPGAPSAAEPVEAAARFTG